MGLSLVYRLRGRFLPFLFFCAFFFAATGSSFAEEAGLSLLDTVRYALAMNPDIRLQQQSVQAKEGALQVAEGQFDPLLKSSLGQVHTVSPVMGAPAVSTNQTKGSISLSKQLRSGITLSSSLSLQNSASASKGSAITNSGEVVFSLKVPLLRGFGEDVTGAAEKAARLELKADRETLRHTVSASVLKVVNAYWSALASVKSLEAYRDSERRAEQVLKDVHALIKGNEMPAAEEVQLRANLELKRNSRFIAEQTLYTNKQQLAIVMGVPLSELHLLPEVTGEFPAVSGNLSPELAESRLFAEQALRLRADLQAKEASLEASDILQKSARKQMKPKLDFEFTTGYSGLDQGAGVGRYLSPVNRNVKGANITGTLSFEFPVGNNVQRGLYLQSRANYERTRILRDELNRSITTEVLNAYSAILQSEQSLMSMKESVRLYRDAVEKETIKLREGMSTTLDLIKMHDNLTTALLKSIAAEESYAKAVVQFRYTTGSLLKGASEHYTVTTETITTLPQ